MRKTLDLLFVGLAIFILSGCSKSVNNRSSDIVKNNVTVQFGKMSQDKKRHIWLEVTSPNGETGLSKDALVRSVLVSQNGKIESYSASPFAYEFPKDISYIDSRDENWQESSQFSNFKLSDINTLSDSQIIAKAQKTDKLILDKNLSELQLNVKNEIKTVNEEKYDNQNLKAVQIKLNENTLNTAKKLKYYGPKAKAVAIKASTDATGNTITSEKFNCPHVSFNLSKEETSPNDILVYKMSFTELTPFSLIYAFNSPQQIFKNYYTGYYENSHQNLMLITKVSKNTKVKMDNKALEGLKVID